MGLDLRIPLGLMFVAIGVLLLGYGAFTWHSVIYLQSMGQNVNVIWGGIMVVFGASLLLLARRSRHRQANVSAAPSEGSVPRRTH